MSTTSATDGGPNGVASLTSGMMTVTLANPKELGGSSARYNTEALSALGYSACSLGAMRFAAHYEWPGTVPEGATIKARSASARGRMATLG